MRRICMVMAVCLPACGLAQGLFVGGNGGFTSFSSGGNSSSMSGSGLTFGRPLAIGSLQVNLRADPSSTAAALRGLTSSYHGRSSSGESYFSRVLMDASNHVYFGYELILEQQQPGTYLATFGKLGLSPMEAAAGSGSKWTEWSMQVLTLPEPRVVHDGDVIGVELMTDAASGSKLIDEITIQPYSQRPLTQGGPLPTLPLQNLRVAGLGDRPIPTVAGNARDFSAVDAEVQVVQPRVTLNGAIQSATGRAANVHGSLVWFYLPDHGRYVLSLAPRPDLDFKLAGEVRGGAITFTLDGDSIKLESPNPIAAGDAPYNLYVVHDPEWEPTARAQKGQFAMGSVDPGELAALKRK
jgi:hypothetical protein